MKLEKYTTEASINKLTYIFESIGQKVIVKVVEYSKLNPAFIGLPSEIEVYNLGFGDWDDSIKDFNDQITSNNGDTDKVLATVANTTNEFWEEYPDAFLYFKGSQPFGEKPLRTRLYQMSMNRYFTEINKVADIFGLTDAGWEIFIVDKNYIAFLISRKD